MFPTNLPPLLDTAYCPSPVGVLRIEGNTEGISAIAFTDAPEPPSRAVPASLQVCVAQLDAYFRGECQTFSFPMAQSGTAFQQRVWQALQSIPFGQTTSYAHIARLIDNPASVRAVGAANGSNQLCIVIPCHRIIGRDGTLVGYTGGLWRKQWLLAHERKHAGQGQLNLF